MASVVTDPFHVVSELRPFHLGRSLLLSVLSLWEGSQKRGISMSALAPHDTLKQGTPVSCGDFLRGPLCWNPLLLPAVRCSVDLRFTWAASV